MKISLGEAADILKAAKSPTITAHVNPDGDALGSMLGLYHGLKSMGIAAHLFLDDSIPAIFSILPGYEVIRKMPEDKNNVPETDLLVVLDADPDRTGKVAEDIKAPILNIDHHVTNKGGNYNIYLDANRAATCEIIFELLKEMAVDFNRDTALCLYTGMATDTGFFRYNNTAPFTLRAAAQLLEKGASPVLVSEAIEQKTYREVKAMADAVSQTELWQEGRAAGIFLDQDFMARIDSTEGFIDAIRVIAGVEIALLLKCQEPNVCRLSMRSRGADVAKIAQSLGGGGHVRAAGATLKMPFDEAVALVKKTVTDALTANEAIG